MRNYGQIVSTITSTPWMMMPKALEMMLNIVEAHLNGTVNIEQLQQRDTRVKHAPRQGAVGVLQLHGPIFPKANMMTEMSGATSLEQWTQQFMQMVDDDSISSIVLDIDSPGGSSMMIPETAQIIREARSVKPIYAVANTMAGSAAYGLAAQATQLFASPSSVVGSIGTYMVHTDTSELAEKMGVKQTVIKAGRFKAVDLETLTPEAQEYMQDLVGDINDVFINEIALGRNMDADAVRGTEARIYAPHKAVDAGLADGVASFDEVIGDLVAGGGNKAGVTVLSTVSGSTANGDTFTLNVLGPQPRASYDADKEHSEPGTGFGGEPTPREPPEEGDPAIENGWRRDSPPAAYETEEAVNREWLIRQAATLGIDVDEDMTDEALAEAVEARMAEIVVPLQVATQEAQQARDFERDYPEQAQTLREMRDRERAGEASTFASMYERFDGQKRGYSPLVRDLIVQSHERVAARTFNITDLRELLDATASGEAVVQYGEIGSGRQTETTDSEVTGDFTIDRQRFTDLVKQAMTEDNLERAAAVAHVSKAHPDLARAYAHGHIQR